MDERDTSTECQAHVRLL